MIQDTLKAFACDKCMEIVTDTTYGLNVDRDGTADRGTNGDKDMVFCNVIESGSFSVAESNRKFTVAHNYEIGLFKRCYKETDGQSYYSDIQYLIGLAKDLFLILHSRFDVASATYDTAVDNLDSNNTVIKLNLTINESVNIC